MKLSCKNIRPWTIFNNATQQNTYVKCYTITQPLAKLSHINLNLESKPFRNIEHLLFQNGDIDFTHPISSSPPRPPPLSSDIDQRWMDYQGIQNWEGLLDPLDDNLRAEIIRYGHFVEAAYRACDFDPSSFSFSKCLYSKRKLLNQCGLPKSGYQVSRNLVATSGIQMPGWIEKVPSWMASQSSWIGYVAVCHDKREIARLGRRDVVIAFRGTATCLEWLENLRANLTSLPNYNSFNNAYKNNNDGPMVESGFLSLYTSKLGTRPSLQDLVQQEVGKILETYGQQQHEQLSFTITGHSLGAALATLVAYDIKQTFKIAPLVTVISFGGPRVGNTSFRSCLETQGTKILRIVNSDDLITKVPGFVIDNKTINTSKTGINDQDHRMANFSSWIQRRIEDTQWVYADIGCELKLSSKDSPYDLKGLNIATCHDLKTYLHLVNGFRSSHCPFKETARRIMNKPPCKKHKNPLYL